MVIGKVITIIKNMIPSVNILRIIKFLEIKHMLEISIYDTAVPNKCMFFVITWQFEAA